MNRLYEKIKLCLFLAVGALTMKGCANPVYLCEEDSTSLENTSKIFVNINGTENGMFITSTNPDNPVLLFISGGPGVPEVWLNEAYAQEYPNHLADYFTVCYWDYYGEGLSYNSSINAKDITVERLAEDAHEVAAFLKQKFNKEKIYLMAHSSGTNLGLYLAQTDSADFYCYFGMGQDYTGLKDFRRYEEGYYFMKDLFEKDGNTKALSQMNSLVEISDDGQFSVKNPSTIGADWENILLQAGCGTTRQMKSDAVDIFFPQMSCKCYTFSEKINYWLGKALLSESSYKDYNCNPETPALIPVIFLSGYYDYTTPVTLSRELLEKLEAPEKYFYTFYDSAHSPLWEENSLVIEAMLKHVR